MTKARKKSNLPEILVDWLMPLFSMLSRIGLCLGLKIFFQTNGIVEFDGLNFVFLSELTVTISRQEASCTLLMHFVSLWVN
jgi:hypothetical protein